MTESPVTTGIPCRQYAGQLSRASSPMLQSARVRGRAEDFVVDEDLGFEPDGAGEHVWLRLRKTGQNTDYVIGRLSRLADVPRRDIGVAGLKDRNAVSSQWFSIGLAGKQEPDWQRLIDEHTEVLAITRHGRKLRRGVLRGNRFRIVLRDCDARNGMDEVEAQLTTIRRQGVPNYFGPQRFGHGGANVERAWSMLVGGRREKNRHKRGIYLSAGRSLLFNAVLSRRVDAGHWNTGLPGDVMSLDGSRSIFLAEHLDDTIVQRLSQHDIHPSGPLWGRGDVPVSGAALAFERQALSDCSAWFGGLEKAGLQQERRALRLPVRDLQWSIRGDVIELEFYLPSGAYATSVLHELIDRSV